MTTETCRHCGDLIDMDDNGTWLSDSDDVCGTDLRRDHEPLAPAAGVAEQPRKDR